MSQRSYKRAGGIGWMARLMAGCLMLGVPVAGAMASRGDFHDVRAGVRADDRGYRFDHGYRYDRGHRYDRGERYERSRHDRGWSFGFGYSSGATWGGHRYQGGWAGIRYEGRRGSVDVRYHGSRGYASRGYIHHADHVYSTPAWRSVSPSYCPPVYSPVVYSPPVYRFQAYHAPVYSAPVFRETVYRAPVYSPRVHAPVYYSPTTYRAYECYTPSRVVHQPSGYRFSASVYYSR